ncbi:hypothetical protein BBF96_11260 [Anoxybacter fermentans]|uniref:Polysaccharide chain length determinant N-terminal domain-containing protein n=1 Tax=Anoxybacter fermentans TaxID=1323375 RepID=A0A3Q9HRI5_9FIRM|nr:Wzz/FepE/Etk N-terminal domain-containing protein [Anoxybacter fermentans]AZR73918.1 hypothetical protein BBF96_11260 [Anoxybacter fermentans]
MSEERYYDEYEIDLKKLIKVVWNGKWFIIGLFIVAVLVAGFYSVFMLEPQYEARATLLILPPKYTTSLQVSTLPVETYKNLLLTDYIKARIIEELDLKHDNGEPFHPSDLEGMMSVTVQGQYEVDDNNREIYVPVLILKVKGTDPKLISDIANAWANNFMEISKQIRKSEVQEVSTVIQSQFEVTKSKLTQVKEELRKFKEKARLDLAKAELDIKMERLSEYTDMLVNLKTQLGSEKAKYQQLQKTLAGMEKEGRWLGDLSTSMEGGKYPILEKARENYLNIQQALLTYQKEHDLDLLQQKIAVESDKLKSYQQKVLSLEATLKEKQIEIEKLKSLLEKEPERWVLKKAITEDAFWQSLLSMEEIKALQDLQLSNEIVNPIYQKLKNKLADDEVLVQSIPEQIAHYKQLVAQKEREINELNYTLKQWQQTLDRLNTDLAHYKQLYEEQANVYQDLKSRLLQSGLNVDSLEVQVAFYEQLRASLEQEIKELQDRIWKDEIIEQQLTQQVNDIQKTYNMLAEKVEEARITEAEKTSDVKFIAEAVPPTKPIGRNAKLYIVMSGILALMVGVFIVLLKEYMKEDEKEVNASIIKG